MKLSLHTTPASLRPISSDPTRCSMEIDASLERILILSGNLAILVSGRFHCAPLGDSSGTHSATGVAQHYCRCVVQGCLMPVAEHVPKIDEPLRHCSFCYLPRITLGLSGAGPRTLRCKQDGPSCIPSRPFVRCQCVN